MILLLLLQRRCDTFIEQHICAVRASPGPAAAVSAKAGLWNASGVEWGHSAVIEFEPASRCVYKRVVMAVLACARVHNNTAEPVGKCSVGCCAEVREVQCGVKGNAFGNFGLCVLGNRVLEAF